MFSKRDLVEVVGEACPEVVNVICSAPWPPVPLSRSVTWIELGLIGIVTSSAVPRTPSGPALMSLIDDAVKCVRSMFLLGRDRELRSRRWSSEVMTWSGVGDVTVDRRGGVVDDERHLGVGVAGVRLVAALVDDPHAGHVVAAVVAGQRRQHAVGADVVECRSGRAAACVLVTSPVLAASIPTVTEKVPLVVEVAGAGVRSDVLADCARFAGSWSARSRSSTPLTSPMPTSRMAVWPASGHECRVGLADRAVEGGLADVVMLSPTMLVSLAGSISSEPACDRRRRRVDDERVVEIAAGVAVARGEGQLGPGRRCRRRCSRRRGRCPAGW